ncbi:MAG TPA: hypothetical protein VMF67_02760 [Rhizomicrobium sp.]|nr:hypothetical protein [Rhizomicrobium sp.]
MKDFFIGAVVGAALVIGSDPIAAGEPHGAGAAQELGAPAAGRMIVEIGNLARDAFANPQSSAPRGKIR